MRNGPVQPETLASGCVPLSNAGYGESGGNLSSAAAAFSQCLVWAMPWRWRLRQSDGTIEMQQERWQRMQALFEQALALAPAQRMGFLQNAESDPTLRAEVVALLDADARDAGIDAVVQRAATEVLDCSPSIGARIGPWRLLDELGAGGMGTVFRAERADGAYQRIVAIKFLNGIPTRDGAERMRRERQILADLDHPNIAGLLDGGTTDEGQPYLVMDYIEGVAITDFARGCGIDQRLRLIQQVARAVHFAHQRLVIHRDLKPANVLVRNDGTPALLDFGIAKLLDADAGESDGRTQAWFTPGYASPEQRRGEAVSTASDIYALGQLLAEVLSGEYRAPSAAGEIVPPSARGLSGPSRRRVRELDAIVLQSCAPRPGDRYPSAEALADDIERYFRHEPLRAAPARPLYLLGKFLRRHRYAAAAVLLFALAIAVFTWRLTAERDRALRAEAQAQQESATAARIVDYLVSLFEAASPEQAGNQPILPGELIDRGRARIGERLADEPHQRARLLGVLAQIDNELGRSEQAAESLREAIDLEREHGTPLQVARHLVTLGVLENQNERPANAETALREAVGTIRSLPGNEDLLSDALGALALSLIRNGKGDEARAHAAEALRAAEIADGGQGTRVAQALQSMAEVDSRSGRGVEAVAAAERALAILRRQPSPNDYDIATAIGFLANTHVQQDQYAQAEVLFREMLEMRLRTLDAGSAWAITPRNNLAQAIYAQGRILDALPLMQENVDLLRARGETETPSYRIALNNVASLHELTGNYRVSIQLFREVYALWQAEAESVPGLWLAQYRQNLGRSLMLGGELAEAWPLLSEEIAADGDVTSGAIERGRRWLHIGEWMRRSRRLDEVVHPLDEAESTFASVLPAGHPRLAAVIRARGLLARDQNRLDDAERQLREALAMYEAAIGPDTNVAIETRIDLAGVLLALGRAGEARQLYRISVEPARALFVDESPLIAALDRLRRRLDI